MKYEGVLEMGCLCPSRGRVALVPGMEGVRVGSRNAGCAALLLLLLLHLMRNQTTIVLQHGARVPVP